jgi:hypothetical protein
MSNPTPIWSWNPEKKRLRADVTVKKCAAWVEYTRWGKRVAWVTTISEKTLARTDLEVHTVMKQIPRQKRARPRPRPEPDLLDALNDFLGVAEPVIRLIKLVA